MRSRHLISNTNLIADLSSGTNRSRIYNLTNTFYELIKCSEPPPREAFKRRAVYYILHYTWFPNISDPNYLVQIFKYMYGFLAYIRNPYLVITVPADALAPVRSYYAANRHGPFWKVRPDFVHVSLDLFIDYHFIKSNDLPRFCELHEWYLSTYSFN